MNEPHDPPAPSAAPPAPAASEQEWASLLEYLRSARGFDFHGYKRVSLTRRILKRIGEVGSESVEAYQDYLETHPDEFTALFNTVLINVTGFFRDPEAWQSLRELAIGRLGAVKQAHEPIRAWSAGCASGEEAYTLAILLAEELGHDRFREMVKIYATDVDEDALGRARHAAYSGRQVDGVSPDLLERYFETLDGTFTFRKDLRRQVIFGRHNLLQDAPISRVDLLACRNTLMYFNAEMQARILSRFQFALNEGGYLFLGRAETMLTQTPAFRAVDLKRRIFTKMGHAVPRDRFATAGESLRVGLPLRVPEAALDALPVAQLVADGELQVIMMNERARNLFGLGPADLGRPLQDLKMSYRPVELRSIIEQAAAERRPVNVKDVEWQVSAGDQRYYDVTVLPLVDSRGETIGTSVTYTDVTANKRLQRDLERSNQELETAFEELQSTNEELETTNEELQSTVEELETTNEELQSTNEELETMNEELQSTNEELHTMNDELRQRGDELNLANGFLASVLGSLRGGVAVVDRELRVIAWNKRAEDLWGVRADEIQGQHLFNLDIGLPLDGMHPTLKACLNGEADGRRIVLDAVDRRGHPIRCGLACSPLRGADDDVRGVILLMEPDGG